MILERARKGQAVETTSRPFLFAIVQTHTPSCTTVIVQGKRASWSPQTVVRLVGEEETRERLTAAVEEKDAVTEAPKPKGKDLFGVKMGSKASAVNMYMTVDQKWRTISDVLVNVPGTNKSNVSAHLTRLYKEGYMDYSKKRDAWRWTGEVKEIT